MGALNDSTPMTASSDGICTKDVPRMAPLVSSESSFSSSSSFGDKVLRVQSPPRLRRSTLDLGQIKSSGTLLPSEPDFSQADGEHSKPMQNDSIGNQESEDAAMRYIAFLKAIVIVESGIRGILDEARQHVQNVFGFLFNTIFAANSNGCTEMDDPCLPDSRDILDEPPPDPLLSPARVTPVNANPRDEWGHFADFQEELVDDKTFLPSLLSTQSSLATLEEDDSDEDEDAFSF